MSEDDRTEAEKRAQAIELLENNHQFPCDFMIKVIGRADDEFVANVLEAIRKFHQTENDPPYRVRETPNGKHVSVTVEPHLKSAEQVLEAYTCIQAIDGVVMVM